MGASRARSSCPAHILRVEFTRDPWGPLATIGRFEQLSAWMDGAVLRPRVSLIFGFFFFSPNSGPCFWNAFYLTGPSCGQRGKGPPRFGHTNWFTKTRTQSRPSTISPPGAAQAASRHSGRGRGGGRGGGGEPSTKKAEATPNSALLFLITTRGPQFPPTHQPPTRPGDFPPSSLKQL